jgi:cell division protein FtsB
MTSASKDFWLKRLFRSNLFFLLVLILLALFSISLFREIMRKVEIQREIKKLEEKVSELENRNTELSSLIQYFRTDEYLEIEARTKLGYKKPGETVVVVTTNTNNVLNPVNDLNSPTWQKSNWQLWLDYFLNK